MEFVEEKPELLCGLVGTEYLEVSPQAVLYFLPGQPAHTTNRTDPAAKLDDMATTAWISMTASAPLDYVLQPLKQLLYPVGAPQTPWDVLEMGRGQLTPHTPPQSQEYYPLVPYAGVRERTDTTMLMSKDGLNPHYYQPYQDYEALLFHARREIIQQSNQPVTPGDGSVYGVTAQGLLVEWRTLTLAQGENDFSSLIIPEHYRRFPIGKK